MASSSPRAIQYWRYFYRLPLLVFHVLIVLPVALIGFMPVVRHWQVGGIPLKTWVHRSWCLNFLRICGIRFRISGASLPRGPALLVANHITWLDILMIHGATPACFVAKAEIRRWPLIGSMAALVGTIYIQRGNSESRGRATRRIAARLRRGQKVAIFPEGGISPQQGVGRFHGRLMAAAIRTGVPVIPVALKYARAQDLHELVVFAPGQNLLANLLIILGQAPFEGRLMVGESISTVAASRNELARRSQEQVVQMYGY